MEGWFYLDTFYSWIQIQLHHSSIIVCTPIFACKLSIFIKSLIVYVVCYEYICVKCSFKNKIIKSYYIKKEKNFIKKFLFKIKLKINDISPYLLIISFYQFTISYNIIKRGILAIMFAVICKFIAFIYCYSFNHWAVQDLVRAAIWLDCVH